MRKSDNTSASRRKIPKIENVKLDEGIINKIKVEKDAAAGAGAAARARPGRRRRHEQFPNF